MSKDNNNKKSIPERIAGFVEKADRKFAETDPKDGSSWASSVAFWGAAWPAVFMVGGMAATVPDYAILSAMSLVPLGCIPVKGHTLYYKGAVATGKAVKEGYHKVKDKVLKRKDMSGTFLHAMNNVIQNGFEKIKETAEKNRDKVNQNPLIKKLKEIAHRKNNLASGGTKIVPLKKWDGIPKKGEEVLLYQEPKWKKILREFNKRGRK